MPKIITTAISVLLEFIQQKNYHVFIVVRDIFKIIEIASSAHHLVNWIVSPGIYAVTHHILSIKIPIYAIYALKELMHHSSAPVKDVYHIA